MLSEIYKTCMAVKYSEGGHLLAAANQNNINIYNPYKLQIVQQFPAGHAGQIRSFVWEKQDSLLISSCNQGILNVWDISNGNRVVDHPHNKSKVSYQIYDPFYDLLLDFCQDGSIRFYIEKGTNYI